MTLEKLRKLQRLIFMGYIIAMPFAKVSTRLSIPLLGHSWVMYMFLLCMGTLIYEYFKFGLAISKKVKWYLIIFFVWYMLCHVLGLVFYEYNETLTFATFASNRLPIFMQICPWIFKVFPELFFLKAWLFFDGMKDLIFRIMEMPFMICYIYHIYQDDFDGVIDDATKACWILCGTMATHSFFELSYYWFGAEWGKNYLLAINPWIYKLPTNGGWWPPLLQYGNWQLRSLCLEPAFVARIFAIAIPLFSLTYTKFKNNIKKVGFLFFWAFLSAMLFATKSRAVNVTLWTELVILLVSTVWIRKKYFTKAVVSVCLVTFFVYFGVVSTRIINSTPDEPFKIRELIKNGLNFSFDYLDENLINIKERDARSNNTRSADIYACLCVLKAHPIFGVGINLAHYYKGDNVPEWAQDNSEIKRWLHHITGDGKVITRFQDFNSYFHKTNAAGIPALIIFILPFAYCVYFCFLHRSELWRNETAICLTAMFIALLILGLVNVWQPVAIPTAFLFLLCRQLDKKYANEKDSMSTDSNINIKKRKLRY